METYHRLDDPTASRVEAALTRSFVSRLGPHVRGELLASATLRRFRPGQTVVDGRGGFGGVTVSGVLRVFDVEDEDDAGLTHRNPAPGEPLGLGALLDVEDDVWIVALTPAEVLSLDLRVVARLRQKNPTLERALVHELLRRYRDLAREYRIVKRGSVRQRMVRQLLDRAAVDPGVPPLRIDITNEQLAEEVGARREVINRALNDLARRGRLELSRARITITDLVALRAELDARRDD